MDAYAKVGSVKLKVLDHPLVAHKLTHLRDRQTKSPTFRGLVDELVTLLAYEATRAVRTTLVSIDTPVTGTTGVELADPKPIVVPILRAGLGMLDGVLDLIPGAKVSVVGIARNHETLMPEPYFERLVGQLNERIGLIIDPMLATGGSLIATIDMLKRKGCQHVRAIVLVAAPEGIRAVDAAHPDVDVFTAAIDSHLNEVGYIIPGLGDAGDKIFGTK